MNIVQKRYIGTLLLIVAAVTAGAAGAALILYASIGTIEVVETPTRLAPRADNGKVSETTRATVAFYRARTGTTLADVALLPADRVGNGVVVTADGWIATAASALAGPGELVAVFPDRTVSAVLPATIVRDEATGLAFVRTAADHRTVATFGDDALLAPGERVYLPDGGSLKSGTVTAVRVLPAETKADLVESTEKMARRLLVDGSAPVGTAVIDATGLVVALLVRDGQAVPAVFITPLFKSVFRDFKATRPQAGLHYVSADLVIGRIPDGMPRTGAVLTAVRSTRAVERGSAGEAAGLKEGDVILAVERDRVSVDATLGELLAQYTPGATIELTLTRGGKEQKLPLTLK